MPTDTSSAAEWAQAVTALGVTGLLAIFGWAMFKGQLVSKAAHEKAVSDAEAETEAVRKAYERQQADERAEFDRRLDEWRRFRDEERARAIESDQHLRLQVEITKDLGRNLGDARVELGRIAGLLAHLAERHAGEAAVQRGADDAG